MRKKIIIFIAVAAAVGGAVYFFWNRDEELLYDFALAEKKDIIQEISATGRVRPAQSIDLAFESAGKVSGVYTDIGSNVFTGQLLAQLNNAETIAQINAAEANINVQEAKLAELKRGARPEEIKVYEVKVSNAKAALNDAQRDLLIKIQDAYTKSDDATRNKVDQLFTDPRSSNPQLNFAISNGQLKSDAEWRRLLLEKTLTEWKTSVDNLSLESDLLPPVFAAKQNLAEIRNFLDKIALVVNSLTTNASLSQTTIDGWKTDVATARTNINTASVNLSASEEKTRTAESGLALAEQELELKKAGTMEEQIAAQEAQVDKARAEKDQYKAQLSKTIIYSPISGVVTKRNLEPGEIVSANTTVFSIISDVNFSAPSSSAGKQGGPASGWEIEADVPEVDIAKLEIGDIAKITLDAYGDEIFFSAVIVAIDPAETLVEGVPSYKTTLQFEKEDNRIRPGMTANLDIVTEKKDGVIVIPQRAVISKNGQKFVRVVSGEVTEEREVKTGLRGSYGDIEILEGIEEGDKVITFMK